MSTEHEFVGIRLRNIALRTGLLIGMAISAVLVAWLWVANRVPQWEPYASARNISASVATALLMAIPFLRFRRQPVTMFVSGLTAWFLLTLTYLAMELHFSLLESRMGALHLFMIGAVCYVFFVVLTWVFQLFVQTRHKYMSQSIAAQSIASLDRPRRAS